METYQGASMHSSHRQLKRWARVVNVVELAVESRKPLKWSRTPIIFDEEDHPDRTSAVGCLPLLVSVSASSAIPSWFWSIDDKLG